CVRDARGGGLDYW
nr:immunoglobulin heavy chain junction region [Macaca mulatta]MOV87517.1 immunoglobulin heavy chain junction region [Macaca mulatta]MOV87751.1 immunoglobulin heavy chain junction region [Macaca mulatta]MOV88070.1 immunoglobulin heavy chain junction region [Macaca mulatta]MOV88348.1 immunoglobulin heavy chain junction region [Macaca mulatta]